MANFVIFKDKTAGKEFLHARIKKNAGKKRAIFLLSGRKEPLSAVAKKMKGLRARGVRAIEFAGYEPASDEHFFDHLALAENAGFDEVSVFTGGMLFSDKDIRERFFRTGFKKRRVILNLPADGIKTNIDKVIGGFRGDNAVLGRLILDKRTAGSAENIVRSAKKRGVRDFMISPALPFFDLSTHCSPGLLDRKGLGIVFSRLAGIGGISLHINFFPACFMEPVFWPMLKFNKGLKNIFLLSSGKKITTLEKEIEKFAIRTGECEKCDISRVCEGVIAASDVRGQKPSGSALWFAADLHIGRGGNKIQKKILRDAENFEWAKGFFVGDIVEGDEGEMSYKKFNDLMSGFKRKRDLHYVIGNHEFCYKKGRPSLEYYKKYVKKNIAAGTSFGNVRLIFLHHLVGAKNNKDSSQTLSKVVFKKLAGEIGAYPKKITVILSHQAPSEIKIAGSKNNLLESLAKRSAPDIWCFGHSDTKIKNIGKFKKTAFVYCGGSSRTGKSKVLIFSELGDRVSVLTRNHLSGNFEGGVSDLAIGKK